MKRQERDGVGNGRVPWKRHTVEEIGRILAGYRDSGLTQREYAQRAGVALSTLLRWLRIHGKGVGPQRVSGRKSAVWVPVAVKSEAEPIVRAYVVEFGVGSKLTIPSGSDVDEVRTVIQLVGLCSRWDLQLGFTWRRGSPTSGLGSTVLWCWRGTSWSRIASNCLSPPMT